MHASLVNQGESHFESDCEFETSQTLRLKILEMSRSVFVHLGAKLQYLMMGHFESICVPQQDT